MTITTKFTVASVPGINTLLLLTGALAKEKFSSLLPQEVIDHYIARHFNEKALMAEVNSLSNQWLVVYVDDAPAGYAKMTSKGQKPAMLADKRAIRIADFGVLEKYAAPAIKDSLLEKCFSACKPYESIWINEYAQNPLIAFFESKGFIRQEEAHRLEEWALAAVCLTHTVT